MNHWLRTVLWREIEQPGTHWCELASDGSGWRIGGMVLSAEDGLPLQARYDIRLDEEWATREVQITVRSGPGSAERSLRITVDAEQRWHVQRDPNSGLPQPTDDSQPFAGLFDIDLSLSPATNTLPIRRIAPAIGESVEVTAVWVGFPELAMETLPQRYTRLDERRYRYESNGGAFVANIEVDDLGLVTRYEGLWERIAEAGPGAGELPYEAVSVASQLRTSPSGSS
jgi:uncharacterized protein